MYYPYLGGGHSHPNMATTPHHHHQQQPSPYAYSPPQSHPQQPQSHSELSHHSPASHSPYPQPSQAMGHHYHHQQQHPLASMPTATTTTHQSSPFITNKVAVPSSSSPSTNKRNAKSSGDSSQTITRKRSRLSSHEVKGSPSGTSSGGVIAANKSINKPGNSSSSAAAAAAAALATDSTSHVTVFQCMGFGDCKMTFTRSEHLARHVRKHTGERPFKCHCGKAFSRLDNLRQHAHTVHSKTPELNEKAMRELTALHSDLAASAAQAQQAHATVMPRSVYEAEAAANALHPSESTARRKTLKYSKRDNPNVGIGARAIKAEPRKREASQQQELPRRSLSSSQASPWVQASDSLGAASISPHESSPFATHGQQSVDRYGGMPIGQASPYVESPQATMAYEYRSDRTGSGSGASGYEASAGTPYGGNQQQSAYYESYRAAPQAMAGNSVVHPAPLQASVMAVYPASTYNHYTSSHDDSGAAAHQYEEHHHHPAYAPPPRAPSQVWPGTTVHHPHQTGGHQEDFYSWGSDMPFASDVRRNSNPFAYGAEPTQSTGGYQSTLSAHLHMQPGGGRAASPPLPPSPSTLAAAGRPVLPPLSSLSRPGTSGGVGGIAPADAERPVSASGLGLRPSSSWGLEGLFGSLGGGSISSASGIGSASVLQSIGVADDSSTGTGRLPSISLHLQNGDSRRVSDAEGLAPDAGSSEHVGNGERRDSLPPLAAALDVDTRRGSLKWTTAGNAAAKRPQTASTASGNTQETGNASGSGSRPSLLSSLASSVLDRDRERARPSTSSTTVPRSRQASMQGHHFGSTGDSQSSPTHGPHASPFTFAPPPLPSIGTQPGASPSSHQSPYQNQSGGVKWHHPRPFGSTSSWGSGGRGSFDEEGKRSGWAGREWGSGSSGRTGSSSGVASGTGTDEHRKSNAASSIFSFSSTGAAGAGRYRMNSANAVGPLGEEPFGAHHHHHHQQQQPQSPTQAPSDVRPKAVQTARDAAEGKVEEGVSGEGAGDERRLSIASLLGAAGVAVSGNGNTRTSQTPSGSDSSRKESSGSASVSASARMMGSSSDDYSESARYGGASRSSYATSVSMGHSGPGKGDEGEGERRDE